jgi:hypothetical protein
MFAFVKQLTEGARRKQLMTRNTKNLPHRILTLLVAAHAAFLCVIFAVSMEDIHALPDKITRQKDAAELARIEATAQVAGPELRDSPPAAASNAGIDRNPAQPKDRSQAKTREARLVDARVRPVNPRTDSASREARRQLKAWKEYQREQAIAAKRQRYAQQGSFFSALSRALGLSTQ